MPLMLLRSSATGSPFYYMLPLVLIIFKVTRKNISNKKGMNIMVWFKFKISFFPPVLVDKKYLTKLKLLCCIIFFFFPEKRDFLFRKIPNDNLSIYVYNFLTEIYGYNWNRTLGVHFSLFPNIPLLFSSNWFYKKYKFSTKKDFKKWLKDNWKQNPRSHNFTTLIYIFFFIWI